LLCAPHSKVELSTIGSEKHDKPSSIINLNISSTSVGEERGLGVEEQKAFQKETNVFNMTAKPMLNTSSYKALSARYL
jgi:hypothetical protein